MENVYGTNVMIRMDIIMDMTKPSMLEKTDLHMTSFMKMYRLFAVKSTEERVVRALFDDKVYPAIKVCDWMKIFSISKLRNYYFKFYRLNEKTNEYTTFIKNTGSLVTYMVKLGNLSQTDIDDIKESVQTEIRDIANKLECAKQLLNLSVCKSPALEHTSDSMSGKKRKRHNVILTGNKNPKK
jgi:hypothetical protein